MSEVLGQGKYLKLINRGGWEYTERCLGSGVVVIVAGYQGKILLVEQYRPSLGKKAIELPAGLVGDQTATSQEKLSEAAHRELLEETGYQAESMKWLFEGPTSSGLTNELVNFFLAENIQKVGQGGGDESENIVVHEIPLIELNSWISKKFKEGLTVDPKIYAGAYFLRKSP